MRRLAASIAVVLSMFAALYTGPQTAARAEWIDRDGNPAQPPKQRTPSSEPAQPPDHLLPGARLPEGAIGGLSDFFDGLAWFQKRITVDGQTVNRLGAINPHGDVIIQPIYSWVDRFTEGFAAVQRDHRFFYVNTRGQEVIALPETCSAARRFVESVAPVAIGGTNPRPEYMPPPDARWGYIDHHGKFVIPAQFREAYYFFDGRAGVMTGDGLLHYYGFIDHSGKWVIPPRYRHVDNFSSGVACVVPGAFKFDPSQWRVPTKDRYGRDTYVSSENATLTLFIYQYGLLGRQRSEMLALLGEPDVSKDGIDTYSSHAECNVAGGDFTIGYVDDRVVKYHRPDSMIRWIDAEHPDKGD